MKKITIDIGLFILRCGTGLLTLPHGLTKIQHFNEKADQFYNFMNLGSKFSFVLIIFAEVVCSLLVILGLMTRLAVIPLIISMSVVVFVVNGTHPLGDKESGLLFLIPYLVLLITGPGKYSMDQLVFRKKTPAPTVKA